MPPALISHLVLTSKSGWSSLIPAPCLHFNYPQPSHLLLVAVSSVPARCLHFNYLQPSHLLLVAVASVRFLLDLQGVCLLFKPWLDLGPDLFYLLSLYLLCFVFFLKTYFPLVSLTITLFFFCFVLDVPAKPTSVHNL